MALGISSAGVGIDANMTGNADRPPGVVLWSFAVLAFGAALFDLLKVPSRMRRRPVVLFSLSVAFVVWD